MKIPFLLLVFFSAVQSRAEFQEDTRPFSILRNANVDGMTVVRALPPKNSLSKLGVRKGDVVVATDYQRIVNEQGAREAYGARNLASVTVLRGGRKLTLGGGE